MKAVQFRPIALALLVMVLAVACGSSIPTATPLPTAALVPTKAANPFAAVPGIVNPENMGWPRVVRGNNGEVTIKAKPQRIVTLSVGHDEMAYALVPVNRIAGVSANTKNATFSNIAELAKSTTTISREPESILSVNPDVMVTSALFSAASTEALTRTGLAVVKTDLHNEPQARVNDILFLGYIFGEEPRALQFAQEVKQRIDAVQAAVAQKAARPRVVSLTNFSDKIYTAGKASTEGSIIETAGGLNVAAEAGLERNPVISVESVIAMRPEIIFIPQPEPSATQFKEALLANRALAEVAAIRDKKVFVVNSLHWTTLSYYNVLGIESLAQTLWPAEFAGKSSAPFSLPKG